MEPALVEDVPHLGALFYHAIDLEENADRLRLLLKAVASVAGGNRLRFFHGMLRRSDKFTREKKLTEKNFDQLEVDLRGRVFSTVNFYERSPRERDMNVDGLTFRIIMIAKGYPPLKGLPYDVDVIAPLEEFRPQDVLISGLARIMSLLESPYGFVHVGEDWNRVSMEVSAVPVMPVWVPGQPLKREPDDPEERALHQRLYSYQHARDILGTKIRRAYHGNFLGKQLVADLGGVESVMANAPAAEKLELPGDAVYVQATPTLTPAAEREAKLALTQLADYLQPITIPA